MRIQIYALHASRIYTIAPSPVNEITVRTVERILPAAPFHAATNVVIADRPEVIGTIAVKLSLRCLAELRIFLLDKEKSATLIDLIVSPLARMHMIGAAAPINAQSKCSFTAILVIVLMALICVIPKDTTIFRWRENSWLCNVHNPRLRHLLSFDNIASHAPGYFLMVAFCLRRIFRVSLLFLETRVLSRDNDGDFPAYLRYDIRSYHCDSCGESNRNCNKELPCQMKPPVPAEFCPDNP